MWAIEIFVNKFHPARCRTAGEGSCDAGTSLARLELSRDEPAEEVQKEDTMTRELSIARSRVSAVDDGIPGPTLWVAE